MMDIIMAIRSKKLFRAAFRNLNTWTSWFVLLKAFFGLSLDKSEMQLYFACTGRKTAPKQPFRELWTVCGRRGGKSWIASIVACYLALFHDYSKYLAPGEKGIIQIVAADRSQAQVILRYCKGILNSNPVFKQYIENDFRESIELSNGINIEVMSCSFRSIRGRSIVCAIFDEVAYWRVEGANPDHEILSAVRPGMATIPTSKLIVISSPYARSGVLYEVHRDYYGSHDPGILVWQADTRTMNPTISEDLINREVKKDPSAARAEWYAEFRQDIETFLSPDAVDRCIRPAGNLAPIPFMNYQAFVDPSGGRSDAMTLAIGHLEDERVIVDLLKAWIPSFDPAVVVSEIADLIRPYRVNSVTGDRYGAAWVENTFKRFGVAYHACELAKSGLYLNLEARINTQQVELPEDDLLIKELLALERRRGRSGKDSVDHPPRGLDDRANAVAGAVYQCFENTSLIFPELRKVASNGKMG